MHQVRSECGDHCMSCEQGKCKKCTQGYGRTKKGCVRCSLSNCKHCDDDTDSCAVCAIYHYREEIKEKRGSFGCKQCGFACMVCEDEEKCLKCGQMFKFNSDDPDTCVANHRILSTILILIAIFLMVTISLSFYYTNMTPDEEKDLIEKLAAKKAEVQHEESLSNEGPLDNRIVDETVNLEARNRKTGVETILNTDGVIKDTERSRLVGI